MDAPKDNKDKISPDPKRTKPGETPETTPEKSEERPFTSTSRNVDSIQASLDRIKEFVLPMADQQKYYYGIYFGLFETRGCVLIYEGVCNLKELEYQLVNQISVSDKKFLPILPDTNDADELEIAVVNAYVGAVKSYVDQIGKELVDGMTIVFPSFPRYLSLEKLELKVRAYVNDKIRKTIDDEPDTEARVFVLEENKMWEGLVPNRQNYAVLHISDYFFLTRSNLPSSTGVSGEPNTLEGLGMIARQYIIDQRRMLSETEFQADPMFGKAKEVFGVASYDALMDAFRFRNTLPNMCRLGEKMAELSHLANFNNDITNYGYSIMETCCSAAFRETFDRHGEQNFPRELYVIMIGSFVEFFDVFSRSWADHSKNLFEKLKFITYKKPEMRNRAEVAAAVYGAKKDGLETEYLRLCDIPRGQRRNP